MVYLKHKDAKTPRTPKKGKAVKEPAKTQTPDSPDSLSVAEVAEAINRLASVVSTFVTQARNGDNGSGLYSADGAYPVRVRLVSEDDLDLFDGIVGTLEDHVSAMGRIAAAFERIADALSGKTESAVGAGEGQILNTSPS